MIINGSTTTAPVVDLDSYWIRPLSINSGTTGITFTSRRSSSIGMNITGNVHLENYTNLGDSLLGTDYYTITGDVTFSNNSAIDYLGIINGQAVFDNSCVYNTDSGLDPCSNFGVITGTTTFNGSSYNGGTVTGATTFNGSSYNIGTPIGTTTFSGSSVNFGTASGDTIFTDLSSNDSSAILIGNVDVYYPVARPLVGSLSQATVTYHGYPAYYFKDQANLIGTSGEGDWANIGNWWMDSAFSSSAISAPIDSDEVFVTNNKIVQNIGAMGYNGATVPVKKITFESGTENEMGLVVGDVAIFEGTSMNGGSGGNIIGSAIFINDLSNDSGTVTGSTTRQYTVNSTTTRNFLTEGSHNNWIVQAQGINVDLTGATYSTSTDIFQAYNGGTFTARDNAQLVPNVNIISPLPLTSTTTIKWKPNINWGNTTSLCQYRYDSSTSTYQSLDCSKSGSDILRPTAGTHTLYVRATDALGNINEKAVTFSYNNTVPVDTDCSNVLDENRQYFLTASTTQSCIIRASVSTSTILVGNGFTVNGDINGNAITTGAAGFAFTLQNIIVTGTVNSNGASGATGVVGGNGGNITISTSTTGAVHANGGNAPAKGGNGGTINIIYSLERASSTPVTAVGGNASSCGYGGSGGHITLTNSTYTGDVSVLKGNDQTNSCPVPSGSYSSGSSGSSVVTGIYTPPSNGNSTPSAPSAPSAPSTPSGGASSGGGSAFSVNNPIVLIPVNQPKILKLGSLPAFGSDSGKAGFSFSSKLTSFLFTPLPKSITDTLEKSPTLTKFLASAGFSKQQDLVALTKNDILLPTPDKNNIPKGLFTVTASSTPVKIYISLDSSNNTNKIVELIKVSPNTILNISLVPIAKGKVTGQFLNKTITFNPSSKTQVSAIITAPTSPGKYSLTTKSSPIPLVIEVTVPKKAGTTVSKKSGIFDWFVQLFK